MRRNVFVVLLGLGILAGVGPAARADMFCNVACNRVTCKDAQAQRLCLKECDPDGIRNCAKAKTDGSTISAEHRKTFCAGACTKSKCAADASVAEICRSYCGAAGDSAKNCPPRPKS